MDPTWPATLRSILEIVGDRPWMGLPVPAAAGVLEAAALILQNGGDDAHITAGMLLVAERAGGGSGQRIFWGDTFGPEVLELTGWTRGLGFLQSLLGLEGAQAAWGYLAPAPPARRVLVLGQAVAELRMIAQARLDPGTREAVWLTEAAPGWLRRQQAVAAILAGTVPDPLETEFRARLGSLGQRLRDHLDATGAAGRAAALEGLDPQGVAEVLKRIERRTLALACLDPGWQGVLAVFSAGMTRAAVRDLEEELGWLPADPEGCREAQRTLREVVLQLEEEGVLAGPGALGSQLPEPVLEALDRWTLESGLAGLDPQEALRCLRMVDLRTLAFALLDTPRPVRVQLLRHFPPDTLARIEEVYGDWRFRARPDSRRERTRQLLAAIHRIRRG